MKLQSTIPSIFTMLNLFSGFLAILQIFQTHYLTAISLIILASIFDLLDGQVARLIHQESKFGIEFDSLADMVSFCLAPSVLVYSLFAFDMGIAGALICFFPLLFGGIRLARFNLYASGERKKYYTGLPVPACAITIGSYVWFYYVVFGSYGQSKALLPLIVILSFLMISKIRFYNFPRLSFHSGILKSIRSMSILIGIALVVVFRGYIIFPIMLIYIVTHILMWLTVYEDTRVHFQIRRKDK